MKSKKEKEKSKEVEKQSQAEYEITKQDFDTLLKALINTPPPKKNK